MARPDQLGYASAHRPNGYDLRCETRTRYQAAEGWARTVAKCCQPFHCLIYLDRVALQIQRSHGTAAVVDPEGLLTSNAVVEVPLPRGICIFLQRPNRKVMPHLGRRKHCGGCAVPRTDLDGMVWPLRTRPCWI